MKKLTVLMPAYNVESYIAESIESVLMQKVNFEYELLIIDDKSTDDTLKIALEYKQKYQDIITVLKNDKNLRALATSTKGYEIIKTDYFCVLDPDDYYVADDFLQKALDFLDSNLDYTIYTANSDTLDINTQERHKFIHSDYDNKTFTMDDLLNGEAVLGHTSSTVFRNIVFKSNLPQELYSAVDTYSEKSFEGDSFRNLLHLNEGKGFFSNVVVGVYRMTHQGIWTSLPDVKKDLMQSQLYFDMSNFFNDKKICEFMLRKSYMYFQKLILSLMQNYSLSCSTDADMNDFKTPTEYIHFKQIDSLYKEYIKQKSILVDMGDWNQDQIDKDKSAKEKEKCYIDSINYYKNSLSWKITKPLRAIRKLLP